MAPSYLSPGIYVEEVDRGSKPIEAVGTAVAAFIGYTERAEDVRPDGTRNLVGKPTLVTNWSQYIQKFGGFVKGSFLADSVYGYFNNGGGRAYIVSVKTLGTPAGDDKDSKAAVAQLGDGNALKITAKAAGIGGNDISVTSVPGPVEEGKEQTFTLNVSVKGKQTESFPGLTLKKGDSSVETVSAKSKLINVELGAAPKGGALAVPAGSVGLAGGSVSSKPVSLTEYQGSPADRTGLAGLEAYDDVTMVIAPDLMSAYQAKELDKKGIQGVQQALIDYCERLRYCFAILDTLPGLNPQEAKEWRLEVNYDSTRAALYYPWVEVVDMAAGGGKTKLIPPSGLMAGVYARTDETRGVHKAPANEIVRGVLGLETIITKGEQDGLNPIGVNCIRGFPGRGIRVWGGRTLSSDPSWRYINVRRLFSMIEASIERGTQWVVFEPNDQGLWGKVIRDVSSFLNLQWRAGALFGLTPEQAYFVKCDEELNPKEVRDAGQLVCEIGISPVKPAEFVIFRISQWSGE
jgi:phage tail sheath protein FI